MYLSKDRMLDSVTEQLLSLSKFVLIKNSLSQTDINVGSEDFFCKLLNLLFDLNLINMNDIKTNYPAIDLGDKVNRISFQITSVSTSAKMKTTIKKFISNELDNSYDRLIFLIISDKRKPNIKTDNYAFGIDVLDIRGLINKITQIKDIGRIEKINNYLQQYLSSSITCNSSILPQYNIIESNVNGYDKFIKSLDTTLYVTDDDVEDIISNEVGLLYKTLQKLTPPELEYIYYVIVYGGQPVAGSYTYTETIVIPSAKLRLQFGGIAVEIFESLTTYNLVSYMDDYEPVADQAYVSVVEIKFWGKYKINYFLSLKKFVSNDAQLREIIIHRDFSSLA